MFKIIVLIVILISQSHSLNSQIWFARNANIRFFSSTPIEDIEAINKYAAGAFNTNTGKVYFKVMMKSFKFEKALMQEHFNENYIESHKYPYAEFEGYFAEKLNLEADGVYVVKIKGKFTIHGVSMDRELLVNMKLDGERLIVSSKFKVKCNDHNIKIPQIVKKNIQEDIEVTLNAQFAAKKL